MQNSLPSVARLLEVESTLNIPSIRSRIARIDAALSKRAVSQEAMVEVSPTELFGDEGLGRDSMMTINLMQRGFAVLCARLPDGTVAAGSEFARLLAQSARTNEDDSTVKDAEVFFRKDLGMLRNIAEEKASCNGPARQLRRPRP